MIGKTVMMRKSIAKWIVDNPEIYLANGVYTRDYYNDIEIYLNCLMDVPVMGQIIKPGSMDKVWQVRFNVPETNLREISFYAEKDFEVLSE
jgi:hypothetical protein